MDTLQGYIDYVTFLNPENGFIVAKFKEKQKKEFTTIVGVMPSVQVGEALLLEGDWKSHPHFGRQFEVKGYSVEIPSDIVGIQKYLESGLIKGIGPVYAEKIVKKFKEKTLDVIDDDPMRLLEIEGIGKKRIEMIRTNWNEQKIIRQVIIFLRTHNISPTYAQKIYKIYGNSSIEKVKENPYILAKDIAGIGFKIADNIAEKLGFEKSSPLRIASGIEYVLFELTNSGHTCYPIDNFLQKSQKILEVDEDIIKTQLDGLIINNHIIKELLEKDGEKKEFIWLKSFYNFEKNIAKELNRIENASSNLRQIDIDKAIDWSQKKLNIELAWNQKKAIFESIDKKLHIITGGPGTGKSTITNAILKISEALTDSIYLAAPTGRAAKRLAEITQKKAFTIHSLLEVDFVSSGFKKNENNPLKCDLIIIDEASMIDTLLLYHLLKAIPSNAKVIFVGDIDQLPSVGAGNTLKDMIASEKVAYTKLTEIYRQAKDSKIISNAHLINKAEMPDIHTDEKSDFRFIYLEDLAEIEKKILKLVEFEIPKKKKFHPLNDIQVISPMKRGQVGIENLNLVLQNALNPSAKPLYRAGRRFHEKDKVMQIRNNYSKNVFNGDIGKILHIDTINQEVDIGFEDKVVTYDFSELDEIALAYCVSVHKYQGSECQCIIMPIHTTHFKLLQKNLLYTAITRGKKLVILIGTTKALAIAVKNKEVLKRHTGLENAIRNISDNAQDIFLPGF
ncbi:MAG: ATP-dependent RecD-like DNA helicase [Candidatus Anoxychlamydiales bacterium]|nr:ATP-dependent RecD-like DNA helicase [Candidatus Anoxychlamydiales bacterium]